MSDARGAQKLPGAQTRRADGGADAPTGQKLPAGQTAGADALPGPGPHRARNHPILALTRLASPRVHA